MEPCRCSSVRSRPCRTLRSRTVPHRRPRPDVEMSHRCCAYGLSPDVTDAIGHAEFATAVPHERLTAFVEDRLVGAIHGDVVDDVVGDDGVTRAHHGYRPAYPQTVDGVPGAVMQKGRAVAATGLLESLA